MDEYRPLAVLWSPPLTEAPYGPLAVYWKGLEAAANRLGLTAPSAVSARLSHLGLRDRLPSAWFEEFTASEIRRRGG